MDLGQNLYFRPTAIPTSSFKSIYIKNTVSSSSLIVTSGAAISGAPPSSRRRDHMAIIPAGHVVEDVSHESGHETFTAPFSPERSPHGL